MLKTITGNLLDIKCGMLLQQVNCRGIMGAGLAYDIKLKWPEVFLVYEKLCREETELMGFCQTVLVDPDSPLYVVNMFCQDLYGRRGQHTDYEAVKTSFAALKEWIDGDSIDLPVYVPFCMGCGLGGGDWETYSNIIEGIIPDTIVVQLEE